MLHRPMAVAKNARWMGDIASIVARHGGAQHLPPSAKSGKRMRATATLRLLLPRSRSRCGIPAMLVFRLLACDPGKTETPLAPMQHDIVDLLGENHARLAERGRSLRACARPLAALAQFQAYALVLGAHLAVLKRVIYPALKTAGWKNVSSTLLVGHAKLTQAFAEVLTLKKGNGAFADALDDLLDATDSVVERERADLLPLLAALLTSGERLAMATEGARFLPDEAPLAEQPGGETGRQTARDWIEEARLLLGGMRPPAAQEPAP